MGAHGRELHPRERAEVGAQRLQVALERGIPELCGGLLAGALGGDDPARREAEGVPREEHRHG